MVSRVYPIIKSQPYPPISPVPAPHPPQNHARKKIPGRWFFFYGSVCAMIAMEAITGCLRISSSLPGVRYRSR